MLNKMFQQNTSKFCHIFEVREPMYIFHFSPLMNGLVYKLKYYSKEHFIEYRRLISKVYNMANTLASNNVQIYGPN